MSILTSISNDLLQAIFCEWLYVRDISAFDRALTNRNLRIFESNRARNNSYSLSLPFKISQVAQWLVYRKWADSRKLHFTDLYLSCSPSDLFLSKSELRRLTLISLKISFEDLNNIFGAVDLIYLKLDNVHLVEHHDCHFDNPCNSLTEVVLSRVTNNCSLQRFFQNCPNIVNLTIDQCPQITANKVIQFILPFVPQLVRLLFFESEGIQENVIDRPTLFTDYYPNIKYLTITETTNTRSLQLLQCCSQLESLEIDWKTLSLTVAMEPLKHWIRRYAAHLTTFKLLTTVDFSNIPTFHEEILHEIENVNTCSFDNKLGNSFTMRICHLELNSFTNTSLLMDILSQSSVFVCLEILSLSCFLFGVIGPPRNSICKKSLDANIVLYHKVFNTLLCSHHFEYLSKLALSFELAPFSIDSLPDVLLTTFSNKLNNEELFLQQHLMSFHNSHNNNNHNNAATATCFSHLKKLRMDFVDGIVDESTVVSVMEILNHLFDCQERVVSSVVSPKLEEIRIHIPRIILSHDSSFLSTAPFKYTTVYKDNFILPENQLRISRKITDSQIMHQWRFRCSELKRCHIHIPYYYSHEDIISNYIIPRIGKYCMKLKDLYILLSIEWDERLEAEEGLAASMIQMKMLSELLANDDGDDEESPQRVGNNDDDHDADEKEIEYIYEDDYGDDHECFCGEEGKP